MLNGHIILLALIQSATEFLPVSSSAHLIILPKIMGWEDQGLAMDVAMHFGTLLAVVIYFFKDVLGLVKGTVFFNPQKKESKQVVKLLIATVPALFAGYFIYEHLGAFRNILTIAFFLIFFGFLLFIIDKYKPSSKEIDDISYLHAFVIGIGQCFALMPGVSRSGITMTIARFFGINRVDSAKFSMLLSIPTIMAASAWTFYKAYINDVNFSMDLLIAVGCSCIFGIIAIWSLMKILQKCSFAVFFGYRLVLGMIFLAFGFNLI